MSKILLTGGAGFIGYHLARSLSDDQDNELLILDNLARGRMDCEMESLIDRENVFFRQFDLTRGDVFECLPSDFDYVYHLAAVIGVKNVLENPDMVLYVNALSVLNILEWAQELGGLERLLFSSSSEVYSGTLRHFGIDIPTDESVPLTIDDVSSARSTYALSKIFGEAACLNYGREHSIPVTIVRYHNVYGPRMGFAHVIPETFIKVLDSEEVEVPSPDHTRAFCYVDDAVEMTRLACESPNTKGEVLHVGNQSEEIEIRSLVEKIALLMGRKVRLTDLPPTPGSPARRCPDTGKVLDLLGYTPSIGLDRGLELTYEWYRDRLDDPFE